MAKRGRPKRRSYDEPVPPTPETVAKLKEDSLLTLYHNNMLSEEHYQHSITLRGIYEALRRNNLIDFDNFIHTKTKTRGGKNKTPFDNLSPHQANVYEKVVKPWVLKSTFNRNTTRFHKVLNRGNSLLSSLETYKTLERDISAVEYDMIAQLVSFNWGYKCVQCLLLENMTVAEIGNRLAVRPLIKTLHTSFLSELSMEERVSWIVMNNLKCSLAIFSDIYRTVLEKKPNTKEKRHYNVPGVAETTTTRH